MNENAVNREHGNGTEPIDMASVTVAVLLWDTVREEERGLALGLSFRDPPRRVCAQGCAGGRPRAISRAAVIVPSESSLGTSARYRQQYTCVPPYYMPAT